MNSLKSILSALFDSLRDLLPIILVIGFFQLAVLRQPIPNFGEIALGIAFVVIGLTLFVQGLNLFLRQSRQPALAAAVRVRARFRHHHRRTGADRGRQRSRADRRRGRHDRA